MNAVEVASCIILAIYMYVADRRKGESATKWKVNGRVDPTTVLNGLGHVLLILVPLLTRYSQFTNHI